MAPIARKAPAPAAAAAPGFDLFNLAGYSSGGGMPEGDYCIVDATIKMHAYTKADGTQAGEPRLGALITFRPLGGDGEDREQFYSMGSKAHESWEPTDDGKGIRAVAGGPGTPPNRSTNWALLVQSLFDAGLPPGVMSEVSGLEGAWVHMQNVPEPSERKGFKATGEAEVEQKARTIAIVSEIKEDGMPWAGSGGIVETATAPAAKVNGKAPAKPVATKKPAQVAAAPTPAADDDSVKTAAIEGASAVLEANPNGVAKLIFKTSAFKAISSAYTVDVARAAQDAFFSNDANMNALLGELGYVLAGGQIKPAA